MIIHKTEGSWNYKRINGWTGGKFPVSNLSTGYHGILKQWLDDKIAECDRCLLVSENDIVKTEFSEIYPGVEFKTLDLYSEMNSNVDLAYDLCQPWNEISNMGKFDIIMCQATLEHLYDPCMAMRNLEKVMNTQGVLLIHTHIPGMKYHPYPNDYLRYYPDWFIDVSRFAKKLYLNELIEDHVNIFSKYTKVK